MKPLKSWRAKTYSRPLATKSGEAFALPTLQLLHPGTDLRALTQIYDESTTDTSGLGTIMDPDTWTIYSGGVGGRG